MIYMLVHKLFFGPKFDSILETDSNGFFLVRKDLPSDCKPYAHLPKPLVQNSLLIFSVEPSGKTALFKDGKWEEGYHNGICALLENYPSVIKTKLAITNDVTIPALSDLSSVAKCENLNLKRLLNRDLKKLVLQNPKFSHLPKSVDFLQAWSEMSVAYMVLTHAISKDCVTLMGDSRFPTGYRDKGEIEEGKGQFGLRCNVTACQTPGQAFFWNLGTSAYYCFHCAEEIRDANLREADLFPEISELTKLHEVNMVRVPLSDLKTPGSDLGEIQWLK